MTLKEAIMRADAIRPNALPDEIKAAWICEIDGRIAESLEQQLPENTFPADRDLLMRPPYDNIYYLYTAAMIDHAQQDSEAYSNDMVMFNTAFAEAKARCRRDKRPTCKGNWRVM